MSEYAEVQQPFTLDSAVAVRYGFGVPQNTEPNLDRGLVLTVFNHAVCAINHAGDGRAWLTGRQLELLQ